MTALTAARNCPELAGEELMSSLTITDAEKMYFGGMMAIDYTDEVQMAANTQGLKVIGRCPDTVDNTDDGEVVEVAGSPVVRGIFRYANSSTYAIPRSAIGCICYVEDDNTVAGYASALVPAGIVHDVDSDGVWVDQRAWALEAAWRGKPDALVAKTDDYTVTAAIAFEGRTAFRMTKSGGLTLTLPSAVAGYRVGVQRGSASATDDVTVQTATGDKIQGFDAISAAAKAATNDTDAISGIVWWRCDDDLLWKLDNPLPADVDVWSKNDA